MNFNFRKLFFLFILLMSSSISFGSEQVLGRTYEIAEIDLLDYIKTKVKNMQANGEWERLQRKWLANTKAKLVRPTPVANVTETVHARSFEYDPTITLPVDLYGIEGERFAKRGDAINPLVIHPIHSVLVFFDGDNEAQVAWVKNIIHSRKSSEATVKPVLVKGSIYAVNQILEQPIYFDQVGRLTTKFHIEHVPAIVEQEGLHLKVSEVLP